LLIEESRTNLILQSENFGTTWTNDTGLVAISLNQTTSPSGAMDADKISENTTASNRRIAIQAQSFVNGTTYTFSCFVKAAERDFVQLRFGTAFGGQFQNFIVGGVNAGTIGSGVGATAAIQAYPNGWYRCSITATSATTGSSQVTIGPQISSTALAWNPYVGTIGSGIFVWGAQNEAGSFATSYIPTVASSVVRSADVCSITGANFTSFWNRFAGTMIVGVGSSLGSGPRFVSNLTSARAVEIYGTNNIEFFEAGGAQEIRIVSGATYPIKIGLAYAINDYQSSYNGLLGGSDTNTGGTIPNATELHIGSLGGTSSRLTGHIQYIRFYKKRLPNAKLQSLTA
jgi:hypothetical protein